jgi:hypothetical protein
MGWLNTIAELIYNQAKEEENAFNYAQQAFDKLDKTDKETDIDLGGVRIRCFGDSETKKNALRKAWPDAFDKWFPDGKVPAGLSVSSEKPEIWCDLRQDSYGNIIYPRHVIGHELNHILKLHDKRTADPDTLTKPEIYRKVKME